MDGGDRVFDEVEFGVHFAGVVQGLGVRGRDNGAELVELLGSSRAGESRMSSVFGLRAGPPDRDPLTTKVTTGLFAGQANQGVPATAVVGTHPISLA